MNGRLVNSVYTHKQRIDFDTKFCKHLSMFVDAGCLVSSMEYFPKSCRVRCKATIWRRARPMLPFAPRGEVGFWGATRHVQTRSCSIKWSKVNQKDWHGLTILLLIGGLEHEFYFSIYWEQSSQLTNSYFSEGLKPPTRTGGGPQRHHIWDKQDWFYDPNMQTGIHFHQ
jgi:hypothetical protein